MGEELLESDLQRVKDLEPQTSKHVSTENAESPESEEIKNDDLEQATIQDEASSSVPSNESLVSEDLESTNSSTEEAPKLKGNSPVVKWDSPSSATEPEIGSNSPLDSGQETSPDNQEIRPTTVSSRSVRMNRLRDIGKKFFEDAPNKIRDMFNSVLPRKDFSMDSPGPSSFYGEGSSGEVQTLQPSLQMRTPLHIEVTSQAGTSGSATATFGSSINGSTTPENSSNFLFNRGGSLLSIQGPKVSNGKASTGEISNLKDDHSSPSKKAKLQIEEKGDESTDSSSSREEVNISPEKENKPTPESEAEDADMNEN